MKSTLPVMGAPPRPREVPRNPGQALLEELDHQPIHLVGHFFLHRVPGVPHRKERRPIELSRQRPAQGDGDPPVSLTPQHQGGRADGVEAPLQPDRKRTRLNSSHSQISYAVFCLKKNSQSELNRCTSALAFTATTHPSSPLYLRS